MLATSAAFERLTACNDPSAFKFFQLSAVPPPPLFYLITWTSYGQSRAGRRVTVFCRLLGIVLSRTAQGTQTSIADETDTFVSWKYRHVLQSALWYVYLHVSVGLVTEVHPVRATRRPTKPKNQVMLNVCHIIMSNYNLLVPTNTRIIVIYCTLSGWYLFRPVIRKLTTKQLKTHIIKLVLTMLCMWMYRLC